MKHYHFISLVIVLTYSLLIGCKDTSTVPEVNESKPAFDLTAAKKAVEEGNKAWSDFLSKGDSTSIAGLYTIDAKIMAPGTPAVEGRENILHFVGTLIRMGIKDFRPVTKEVWGNENLLGEEGTWSLYDNKGSEMDHGKYLLLWKMEEGKWKLFRDCWNSDGPRVAAK